jgi:thioredoxin 1
MTTAVSELTEHTFDESIGSAEVPVVVEFWAEWCPPCKTIAPVLESIAEAQGPAINVFKVNVDEHPELAARFEVFSIPTVLVFREGSPVGRMVGARGQSRLLQEIEESIR